LSVEENLVLYKLEKDREEARTDRQHLELCRKYWSIIGKAYYADPANVSRSRGKLCASPPPALASSLKVYASVFDSVGDWDWRDRLGNLRVPTLVIHGEQDAIPLDAAREWASVLPDARLVVLPDAGHLSYVEQPDLFFAAVEDFLK
jgi:pimeloyl-ACP methyl ester carboxylesterase